MFEKLKIFFNKIFGKTKMINATNKLESQEPDEEIITDVSHDSSYNRFDYMNYQRNTSFRRELNQSTEICNIQKDYDDDRISEDDLTISQIKGLISLYDEQIKILETNIKLRREAI